MSRSLFTGAPSVCEHVGDIMGKNLSGHAGCRPSLGDFQEAGGAGGRTGQIRAGGSPRKVKSTQTLARFALKTDVGYHPDNMSFVGLRTGSCA